ncbi:MAG: PBP1A family penicillin-binding protein [Herpetosiphon sp.]
MRAVAALGTTTVRIAELLIWFAVGAILLAVTVVQVYSRNLPDPATLATHRPSETTRIYARDGQTLLYQIFDDGQRTVVPLSDIPWGMQAATVAVEDANFISNPGIDLRGVVRALYLNRTGQIVSGGSTITQQLVRNVLLSPEERTQQSFRRKVREAILAFRLSRSFSKEQVLSLYLNEVYYGNLSYGVEAAAQGYFGKSVRDLSMGEAALLAGLPQSPTDLNPLNDLPAARVRQHTVLQLMVKQGLLNQDQATSAAAEELHLKPQTLNITYPHWVWYIRDMLEKQYGHALVSRGGLRVVTTLDPAVQAVAEQAARQHIADLLPQHATNAAVVIIDPATNEILAMVGSIDYNNRTISGQVNVALAPRQPGSALKPLIYAAALAGGWNPATIIWDVPTTFAGGYTPQNYDNTFHGPQRLRTALAGSLNIPAIKTLQFVGLDRFLTLAHRMGITTLNDRERYGLAISLGGGEVKLIDLTTAYTTLANGGDFRPPAALLRVTTGHGEVLWNYQRPAGEPVLGRNGPQVSYQIADILSDNAARTPIFGPNSILRLPGDRPAAVKTGTSNDYRDSWAVGWTPDLVVGVWVGNSDNTPMQQVAGANGAGKIWNTIMQRTHVAKPPQPFVRPDGLEDARICSTTGLPDPTCTTPITEHFIVGTTPTASAPGTLSVTVAGDGGCLASDSTPLSERRQQTFLQIPADAVAWARTAKIPQPPTIACVSAPNPAASMPAAQAVVGLRLTAGARIGGTVEVLGDAAGQYVLDVGRGAAPASWNIINTGSGPVDGGWLATWDTVALEAGTYTLRLRVSLPGSPEQQHTVTIEVVKGAFGTSTPESNRPTPLPSTPVP